MNVSIGQYRRWLWTYLRPQWRAVALLALLLFGGIGLELLSPQILRRFLDTAQRGGPQSTLFTIAIVFLVVALIAQTVRVGATFWSERVGWRATNRLRGDLLRHTLHLDLQFHKQHPPGALIERVDGDVTALANFFGQFAITLLGNGLLLVGILVALWLEDWRVGVGVAVYALATLLLLGVVQRIGAARWAAAQQADADWSGFAEERLRGTEDIRANGAVGFVMQQLDALTYAQLLTKRRAQLAGALTHLSTHLLFAIGYAVGLAFGAWLYTRGEASIGTAFLITAYVGLLARPLEAIRAQVEDLQQAAAGIARVGELLALQPSVSDNPKSDLPSGPLAVQFDAVHFAYNDEPPPDTDDAPATDYMPPAVLDRVSFDLPAGHVLGVLGRTGSGKTTLTRLLFRLYDPQGGAVRLGGIDIRDVSLRDLRRRVGMVTQDVQIFGASVRDNITLFNRTIPDQAIWEVLDMLGLHALFASLPRGLDTPLGSGGHGLSAGQAQLLACARVFLRDPDVIILDEASSRLDPATEALLERAIDKLLRNRTAIVIAHRLQTVRRADNILILDNGRIAEHGSRSALAADPDSRFAALLRTGLEEVLQ
jgi:ATP-binding cassette, subfamily B, bacterial